MSLSEFARQAGIDRQTLYNLRNGKNSGLRTATKQAIERILGWVEGSVDDVLAGHEPTPRHEAAHDGRRVGAQAEGEQTFEEALDKYQKALRRLRRVASADPAVPPEVADIVETWNTFLQALLYGGPSGVRKAVSVVAQGYEQGRLGEEDSPRAG